MGRIVGWRSPPEIHHWKCYCQNSIWNDWTFLQVILCITIWYTIWMALRFNVKSVVWCLFWRSNLISVFVCRSFFLFETGLWNNKSIVRKNIILPKAKVNPVSFLRNWYVFCPTDQIIGCAVQFNLQIFKIYN